MFTADAFSAITTNMAQATNTGAILSKESAGIDCYCWTQQRLGIGLKNGPGWNWKSLLTSTRKRQHKKSKIVSMTGYSYETSKPAQHLNEQTNKTRQCDEIMKHVVRGANNLLRLHELTGIPQSTVSARVNDLIYEEKKIRYDGFVNYSGMKRKKIVLVIKEVVQSQLF